LPEAHSKSNEGSCKGIVTPSQNKEVPLINFLKVCFKSLFHYDKIIFDIHEKINIMKFFLSWRLCFIKWKKRKYKEITESVELGGITRLEVLIWTWKFHRKLKLCFINCITSFLIHGVETWTVGLL
jgi:hypothetical protein